MHFRKPFGRLGRIAPPRGRGRLPSAFHNGHELFGPVDLREDRIRAEGYLPEDLSPAARRALRDGDAA